MFGNRLLDCLPGGAAEALRPHLVKASVAHGERVAEIGESVTTAYFPVTAQFANVIPLKNGGQTEVSAIGTEGVTGLAPVLAGKPCGWDVIVRQPGDAWSIAVPALRRAASDSPALMEHLLVLAGYYQTQAGVSAACIAHHPVSARLARFLLTTSDLAPGSTLQMTQDDLARALGATRTTVSTEAGYLKEIGGVRYSRGRLQVVDRVPLERYACECYGLLRSVAERDGLLPPRGS